jgi:hypothetical protein
MAEAADQVERPNGDVKISCRHVWKIYGADPSQYGALFSRYCII